MSVSNLTNGRPTWAEINLENLAFNLSSVRRFLGSDVDIMAVVKANAYGHGAVPCAQRLEKEGVTWFAVALVSEAIELRGAGISNPILVLGSFWAGEEQAIIDHDLTPVVFSIERINSLNDVARSAGKVVPIHIKIDTGMGRVGIRPDEVEDVIEALSGCEGLKLAGLMTHFASADDLGANDFTARQISIFDEIVRSFGAAGFEPEIIDLANSPGAVTHPNARRHLVRLGGILYGLGGDVLPNGVPAPALKPVMSVLCDITHLKTIEAGESVGYGRTFIASRRSRVATVAIGYADGYPRALSNQGKMLVRGQVAPVIGRVSMDWTILDVTDVPDVEVGDQVTVIGSDGGASVKAEDIAAATATISYEITCGFSSRVPRLTSS